MSGWRFDIEDDRDPNHFFASVTLVDFDYVRLDVIRENEYFEMSLKEAEELSKALAAAVREARGD